jgi:nickel-dependent lactate racemase
MNYTWNYGKEKIEFTIEEKNLLLELVPNKTENSTSGVEEVERAINNPIGTLQLSEIVNNNEKVCIITSDITRPMPTKIVLPYILNELNKAGVQNENITLIFALGSHRNHTIDEMRYLTGYIYDKIQCIDSDMNDCINLGTTSNGTPVDIFSVVANADRRICLGNIEMHYFAGYSGGAKALMPGVSSRAAIQANHSFMVNNSARAGQIDENPVRTDIDEVVKFVPIDFILNVILDEKKNIIKAVAGHYLLAHRAGCEFLDILYKVKIPEKADIVITTPGGYPKDINLYQAQKALDNAKHAVREGGIIIFVAACTEGLGEEVFEKWIINSTSPDQMIADIQNDFQLGGHKAAAIALVRKKVKIFIVSELNPLLSKRIFMESFTSVEDALSEAFLELGEDSKIILMPYGGSTLPNL